MQSSARKRLPAALKTSIQSASECGDQPAGASVTDRYRRSVVLDDGEAAKARQRDGFAVAAPDDAQRRHRARGDDRRGCELRQLRAHDRADVRDLAQVGAEMRDCERELLALPLDL